MPLRKTSRRIIIYIAVIGLLIFLYTLGLLRPVEGALFKAINPVLGRMHGFGADIRSIFGDRLDSQALAEKNSSLEKEISALVEENANYKMLEQENGILRESLGFLKRNNLKYKVANVISQGDIGDISGRTETVYIDKGERDGLKKGYAIVSSEGVMLGKIAELKENTSLVYLANNSLCKIAAAVLNGQSTSGITEGELGLTIRMNFIPQSSNIKPNDIVVSSGLEEYIPRGLVIGRVRNIKKENNDLWQEAEIESMARSDSLVIVSVIIP